MKLAILQPSLFPDLHYLAALLKSDRVFLQDEQQFSRKSTAHRFKIRTPNSEQWIGLPLKPGYKKVSYNQVVIEPDESWLAYLEKTFQVNYANSIYYEFYSPEILADFERSLHINFLMEYIHFWHERMSTYLQLDVLPIDLESKATITTNSPDLIAESYQTEFFYQENGARHYQRQSKNQRTLILNDIAYKQHFEGFVEGCCWLDLLFNRGPEAYRIIDKLLI